MLRVMSERDEVGVVADQVGSPTWANGLATAVWQAVEKKLAGTYHWADAGVASWYDFAVAIQEEALVLGLLNTKSLIKPIRTEDYPTAAQRPAYSVLEKTDLYNKIDFCPSHWRTSLTTMLKELKDA